MKHILRFTFFLILCLLGSFVSYAQQMPFQGRLMQNNLPVNDTLEIGFAVAAVSWSETHPAVIVTDGLYSVVLGSQNPMPESLFDGVSQQSLEIAINGVSLSPVMLYPSLAKPRTRLEKSLAAGAVADTARYTNITGGGTTGYNIGSFTEMSSNAGNIPYYGMTQSQAGTSVNQYGVVGEALGEAVGEHVGVYGGAAGKGKINGGVYGVAYGDGDGSTGYGTGSYNNGVVGRAMRNPWGNTGVFGRAYGNLGVDNIGVAGWSEVNSGGDTTLNSGVLGWAKGPAINRGIVGLATGGTQNWAGWFEGDVKMEGKYLHARLDSVSINDVNGRQAIVLESMYNGLATSFIGGYGSNGLGNFFLYSNGPDRNYGNLGLKNDQGVTKAWLSAYYTAQSGQAAGLLSLYGPTGGWIGGGFKHWEGDSAINLPYISLEGNLEHQALIWMSVDRNENGQEFGAINLTSGDGRSLRIDAYSQLGIPSRGPTTENFLMTGKDWEGKGDYPIFELRGTINSMADGTGYTLPLVALGTTDDGVHEMGYFGIQAGAIGSNSTTSMVNLEVRKNSLGIMSGTGVFRGEQTENVVISSAHWETGGTERGFISILGNSQRTGVNGGTYNPTLFMMHVMHDSTEEVGAFHIEDQGGQVYVNANASGDGIVTVGNEATGTSVVVGGSGDINATGNIQGATITQTSDRRYKENILDLENSLQHTLKLRGVSYYWKDKVKSSRRQIGLIAQEVEEVYPEFVHTDANGYKSVNYAGMVAVLIEAVKELETKIVALEQDKANLSSENASLKASLEAGVKNLNERMLQLEQMLGHQPVQAGKQTSSSVQAAGK